MAVRKPVGCTCWMTDTRPTPDHTTWRVDHRCPHHGSDGTRDGTGGGLMAALPIVVYTRTRANG
ncbi:MAG: hypothetical protein AAFO97_15085 [Pseudomonadota bacterium]